MNPLTILCGNFIFLNNKIKTKIEKFLIKE